MKSHEGKVAITFQFYCYLAKRALFAAVHRSAAASFVHLFLILCWNMFARSCSVVDLRTHHFSWEQDSLVIDMSRQKADQTGEKMTPKHIFANPFEPAICPILAMALHLFSISFRPNNADKSKLFVGAAYDTFSKWLNEVISAIPNLNYDPKSFGTHSFRKGIASYCSGFIGGPPIFAIFLRAGWSISQVMDRYITYTDGGDQLCGRVACGLNFNDGANFAVLPPHFINNSNAVTPDELEQVVPGYADYPENFKACIPYLLASLVYHYEWLTEKDSVGNYVNMAPCHPFFTSIV
jgi:hypothetical protein